MSLISDEKLRELYARMLQCRLLDERVRAFGQKTGLAESYVSSVGMEAVFAGTAIDLRARDALSPSRFGMPLALAKGVPLASILKRLKAPAIRKRQEKQKQNPQHRAASLPSLGRHVLPPGLTPGAELHVAVGVALANKLAKNDQVTVAYLGDEAHGRQEAMEFAGVHDLPVVFVSLDSFLANGDESQPQSKPYDPNATAQACDFPAITVDGIDVVAAYRVAQEAIARARRGQGPTLIEAIVCQLDHSRKSRLEAAGIDSPKDSDPIFNMEIYLTRKKLFTPEWKQKIVTAFEKKLDASLAAARPGPEQK
jgi:TPP-dependent pyruvate/acetoin dehydrogenase alpha subunit